MRYVLCFAAILFLSAPCAVVDAEETGASTTETKSAKRDRYLLLDERIVAQAKNAKLTIGKVEKHPRTRFSQRTSRGSNDSTTSTPT